MPLKPLKEKIATGQAIIGVVGLGYIGLPLALAFAEKFRVIGYDTSPKAVDQLSAGHSYIDDISPSLVRRFLERSFEPTCDPSRLGECDLFIICVPTPLNAERKPDLSHIISAAEAITEHLKPGQFVILESTTYPGTTEEVLLPLLEKGGLKAGEDLGLAYSPERVDPGNKKYTIRNTPKVVGGMNEMCTDIASELYGAITTVHRVSGCKEAEAAKIVENVFRNVNIALVNELALIFEKLGIDTWEVMDAAASKPFGFMPFYPG
ncbi:MAG: nucleotide sugar dehydrogenase, partial [Thermoplasmata archaeon]|nr:nucleotide sugar dehydrogenase [Thermoplasmata archaeon]